MNVLGNKVAISERINLDLRPCASASTVAILVWPSAMVLDLLCATRLHLRDTPATAIVVAVACARRATPACANTGAACACIGQELAR